jgi:hypothetical protein
VSTLSAQLTKSLEVQQFSMINLVNTNEHTGNARIQSFMILCLNDGYDAFVNGEKKSNTTGVRLCERHCSEWRKTHETWAKRVFSIGFEQGELDQKITTGELV